MVYCRCDRLLSNLKEKKKDWNTLVNLNKTHLLVFSLARSDSVLRSDNGHLYTRTDNARYSSNIQVSEYLLRKHAHAIYREFFSCKN